MNPEVLERILSCNKLPTLPAVAVRVVELTSQSDVSMKALAETIQNDQALAAKVLRTVNSSLYGLRQKCSSINQAIVMLGLSAVKTLALGFTLVEAIKESTGGGEFDLAPHWRRALYTAIAAKQIADHARLPNAEECFLGGLLQDVGMIALHQALGDEYLGLVRRAGEDHRAVADLELAEYQVQHSDVGALLALRWKLPDTLVMPVKYHERPTAAPREHEAICRAVGLGNVAADILTSAEPAEPLRRFYRWCEQWFAMNTAQADDVLRLISQRTREAATLLSVPASPVADAGEVLEVARKRLAEMELPETRDALGRAGGDAGAGEVDELTGAGSRSWFDRTLIAAFEQARAGGAPVSVALFDVDDLERIATEFGPDAGDAVMIAMAARLARAYEGSHPLVCRYGQGTFGVVLPRTDRFTAVRLTEQARQLIARTPVKVIAGRSGTPPEIAVTTSVGLAAVDGEMADRFDGAGSVTKVAEKAVLAARRAGRNTMRVYAPVAKAA